MTTRFELLKAKNQFELLTVDEVCAELRITRSTFYDWRAKGKAPSCHRLPNGAIRVSRDALNRWFNALGGAA
jgi:excisionase family DNA binding protein